MPGNGTPFGFPMQFIYYEQTMFYTIIESIFFFKYVNSFFQRNGMMEECEFKKALEHMHITDNMTVLHHWSIMDEDKDGIISMEEFDRQK